MNKAFLVLAVVFLAAAVYAVIAFWPVLTNPENPDFLIRGLVTLNLFGAAIAFWDSSTRRD